MKKRWLLLGVDKAIRRANSCTSFKPLQRQRFGE
jgi:hypothetical protein